MPKKGRKMDLPTTIEREPIAAPVPVVAEVKTEPAPQPETEKTVSIQLPVGELGSGYGGTNRVDVQRMTPKQKRTLRRVLRGLEDSGARMADGRPVRTAQDVFKYILDRVG